jgi:hypothetical protein
MGHVDSFFFSVLLLILRLAQLLEVIWSALIDEVVVMTTPLKVAT